MEKKILPCVPGKIENAEVEHDPSSLISFLGSRQGVCSGCDRYKNISSAQETKKFIEMNAERTRIKACYQN